MAPSGGGNAKGSPGGFSSLTMTRRVETTSQPSASVPKWRTVVAVLLEVDGWTDEWTTIAGVSRGLPLFL